MSDRQDTLGMIERVRDKGADLFDCEPIGFVLLYPEAAYLKAVWKVAAGDRELTSQALMNASLDEMAKAEEAS